MEKGEKTMTYKILAVDDEFSILEVISAYLRKEGYDVHTAMNGKDALSTFEQVKPHLIILDLMLPDLPGEMICEKIRQTSDVPIIMLTAKKEEDDRISGLIAGADDYLMKPFSPKELMVRIQGMIRRVYGERRIEKQVLSFQSGDLEINQDEICVYKKGQPVELTKNEYEVLAVLARNPGRTFTREQLIESAFGSDYLGYDRTVDVYIKNIRKKIEDDSKEPIYVVTVYGFGYAFKGGQ